MQVFDYDLRDANLSKGLQNKKFKHVENLQVYDYDWGVRDDFMGEASLPLGQLVPQKRNDLVLTLAEPGLTFSTMKI